MTIPSYPLQWPLAVARTPVGKHVNSPFRTQYTKAIVNVVGSLKGFQRDSGLRIDHPVISSNVDLIGNVLNRDHGAAVWFMMDGQWVAFGVDRFPDVASNVQAVHHIIEARRVELRYGGLAIVRQTFQSFKALPAPQGSHWSDVLGLTRSATESQITEAYRAKARTAHPDNGGSTEAMAKLNAARDAAVTERTMK